MDKVLDFFKTQDELAKALKVSQPSVAQWLKTGVPVKRAVEIEQVTDGVIKREDLRPDIFK